MISILCSQLSSYPSQETTHQQAPVHKEEETAGDAGHAAAAEEVESGRRGDVQGGASSAAAAEPPTGSVPAAAGAYDEPPGEDDPASHQHVGLVGPERGQRSGEALKWAGLKHSWQGTDDGIASLTQKHEYFLLNSEGGPRYF